MLQKNESPAYTEDQINKIKTQCRHLYRKSQGMDFVIDDEHYFTLFKSNIPENTWHYTDDKDNCPSDVKFYKKQKFEKKIMIWIAMSPKGLSSPFFIPSGLAINQNVYKDDCLAKILIPYIHQHYPKAGYIFWPDKASSHYSKTVKECISGENINFVEYNDNPTNLPQARPVEDFFWRT
jgi:hypothetical protein